MLVFGLFGSAEVQSWNTPPQEAKTLAADLKATQIVENVVKISTFLFISAVVLLLVTYI